MLPNPQTPVDLVKPTEEIPRENFLFCAVYFFNYCQSLVQILCQYYCSSGVLGNVLYSGYDRESGKRAE